MALLLEIGSGEAADDDAEDSDEAKFVLSGLFTAVASGEVTRVKDALLTLPPTIDLNLRGSDGCTVVHAAVQSGCTPVLEALASRGADLHQLNANCESGLHIACRLGNRSVVAYLLDNDVCQDAQTRDGDSPLHLATRFGHLDILQLLCRRGACVNTPDRERRTPLHAAADCGCVEAIRLLLLNGADAAAEDRNSRTPLLTAIVECHQPAALLLINAGSPVDAADNERQSGLHLASGGGQLTIVQALCAFGCTIDTFNSAGITPLHAAARAGHLEVARCLLLAGANPHLPSREGLLPEVMALAQGHSSTASLLGRLRPERRAVCVEQLVPTQRRLPRVKLKVFGHSACGKTSLIDSLRSNLITGFFRKKFKNSEEAASDEESQYFSMRQRTISSELNFEVSHEAYTRGIAVQSLSLTGVGEFSVWEFSGYEPYYVFYDHFIGDTSCVHAILFSLTDSYDMMRQKALFWVNFVLGRVPAREPLGFCGRPRSLARIVLIGTHADKAAGVRNDRGLLENPDAARILEEVQQLAQHRLDVCNEVFVIDCHEAMSADTKALRQRLCDWRTDILKHLPNSNGFLEVVASKVSEWSAGVQFPVLTWHEFVDTVRTRVNPLCSEEHLKDLIQELQYIGEVVYLESDLERDMIVLSPQWLCGSMLGYLLSHDNIAQARVTGSFTVDDIQFMIAEAEASQLVRVLSALDLCTPVELDGETQYEFSSLNFLESLRGLWEKEIQHDDSLYAGVEFRASRWQLVHIFPRIQCAIRRSLQCGASCLVGRADLFQWFHGSKLTLDSVECMLRVENCDQSIRLRARGPQRQLSLLFGIYQDIVNIVEQTIDEMCPGMDYEVSALSPKELKRHSKLVVAVPQGAVVEAVMEQRQGSSEEQNGELTSFPPPPIVVNYEDGLVHEDLEHLLCFGSRELLSQLKLGPQLHLSCLRTPTFQRLCGLFDPPEPMGKDWCLLAVKLGMTHSLPSIDSSNQWLRSRTAKILDEWSRRPDCSVGRLADIFKEMGREDARQLLLSRTPMYTYSPQQHSN